MRVMRLCISQFGLIWFNFTYKIKLNAHNAFIQVGITNFASIQSIQNADVHVLAPTTSTFTSEDAPVILTATTYDPQHFPRRSAAPALE